MNKMPSLSKRFSQRKSRGQFLLRLVVSLGFIGVVLYFINIREVVDATFALNPWYLIAAFVLTYLDRALMSYKWNLLLAINVKLPFFVLFRTYLVAPLCGMLFPSTIGGDLFRLYSLSRYKVNASDVVASMLMERLIGFVALLALASLSLGGASYVMQDRWAAFGGIWWALLIGAMTSVGVIGAMHGVGGKYMNQLAERCSSYPIVGKLYRVYVACCAYRNHLRTVAVVCAWSLLEQMTPILTNILLVQALHIHVSWLELVAIIPVIVLAIRLPISFDGVGVQEGLYVALFGLVGVSASEAFLLSTMARVTPLLCALPWCIPYMLKSNR
jgi:uncharacterized protein (TIRG00374 family)